MNIYPLLHRNGSLGLQRANLLTSVSSLSQLGNLSLFSLNGSGLAIHLHVKKEKGKYLQEERHGSNQHRGNGDPSNNTGDLSSLQITSDLKHRL